MPGDGYTVGGSRTWVSTKGTKKGTCLLSSSFLEELEQKWALEGGLEFSPDR